MQDKIQKSFKPSFVSDNSEYDGAHRAVSQQQSVSTMSFTKGFVHDDSREEALVYKPQNPSKAFAMSGADMGADQFASFKPLQLNVELKENEKVNGPAQQGSTTSSSSSSSITTTTTTTTVTTTTTEQKAQTWEGPLSRFTTYTSVKDPKACLRAIEESLHKMEEKKLVDWEVKGYSVFGRMYDGLEMSEYMINVYISGETTEQFQSVIEVRRASGDAFVHDKFFCQILNLLGEEDIVERKTDNNGQMGSGDEDTETTSGFGFGIGLEGLSSLQPLSLSPDDLAAIDADLLNDLASSKDAVSDDDTIFSELTESTMTTAASVQQLADELIEVVTDKDSFQEALRHSSGVLAQELQNNTLLLEYVATQTDIIEKLIKPLTGDFYDTLIIRNVLQAVKQLLQHENAQVSVYNNCSRDIRELKKKWTTSVQHRYIDMQFGRSQQVERLCSECLELLQKKRF